MSGCDCSTRIAALEAEVARLAKRIELREPEAKYLKPALKAQRAKELRAAGWKIGAIARELDVTPWAVGMYLRWIGTGPVFARGTASERARRAE